MFIMVRASKMARTREYYHVVNNRSVNYGNNDDDLYNLVDELAVDFHNDNIQNFGKLFVPVASVDSTIHEFIYRIVGRLFGFQLIEASDTYYFFSAQGLYFNVSWKFSNGFYEFGILYGINFEKSEDGVYVFCFEDDEETVISPEDIPDDEFESEEEDDENFSDDYDY